MTKAAKILELAERGHTTRVIAEIVYGLDDDRTPRQVWVSRMAYVRSALQRADGQRACDRAWRLRRQAANRESYNDYMRGYMRGYNKRRRAAKALGLA